MTGPIIVGVNEFEHARDALALGQILSDVLNAPLLIACCYGDELGGIRGAAEYEAVLRDAAEARLAQARAGRTGIEPGDAQTVFTTSPARGLTELAEKTSALAVVVGSSHRGPTGRTSAGSVVDRLIHGAPCAVAVAPDSYQDESPDVVGVAYEDTPEARSALSGAALIAAAADAELRIVNVLTPPNPANPLFGMTSLGYTEFLGDLREERREQLRRASVEVSPGDLHIETELLEGVPESELLAESGSLGLLVIGSRCYGPLRRVVAGSASAGVLRGAACPVCVVPRGIAHPLGLLAAG